MKKNAYILAAALGVMPSLVSAQAEKPDQYFGSLKARHIGPALMSGRISDLAGHPTNSKIMFAGTAGGGVWKSVDGGTTYNSVFDQYCQSIGAMAIDPKKPDQVVWVGTGETWTRNSVSVGDGLYKTTDGGANWVKMGFANSDRISSIQINPNNTDEVYVAVLGALWGDDMERGVYKTTDGGATWAKVLAGDKNSGCSDLVMDPNNPNVLYAAFWEFGRTAWSFSSGGEKSSLQKSEDGGKTWTKIHNGFPAGKLGRFAVAVAPSNSNIVYAVVEAAKDKGLYRSDDGGKNWKFLNSDFELTVRPFYFSRIVVDPKNPEVVVKGGLSGSISRDGGKTFKNLGYMHSDIHDIWFDPKDSDRMTVATDGGVYRSYDGGGTMEMVNNLPVSQFYQVSVDNAEPYNVYGGLQDNGSWYGPSSSPEGVEAKDWSRIGYGDGFRVFRHPTKNIIYSEMQGADNIWKYDVDNKLSKNIKPFPAEGEPKARFNWNTPIMISPNKPDRLYVGSQFLYRSEDMGDNWQKISPDLTTNDPAKQNQENSGGISMDNSGAENNTTIFTVSESPLDENIVWVGTDDGNVQVTQDGGKSWTKVSDNIPGLPKATWCYQVSAGNFGKGTAYAVFDGHTANDKKAYVYKTTDFGKTWKSLVTPDINSFARSLQEDLVNENLLFVGTEIGLFVSVDGGASWGKFTNNMPSVAVMSLAMHPKTNDLVMGTHGRGIIIIDDISPLRELTPDVLAKSVHFFQAKPNVIREGSGFGGGSTETQFVGANPDRSAKIVYYLKKRHTFGNMNITLYDAAGKKVTELDPGKQKGINIVTWPYTLKAPKTAKGKTFSFGGFSSPQAPAGKYKVVMEKAKEKFETEIEIVYNPKSPISAEARKAKHETIMTLYGMSENLAYMVYEMDSVMSYANSLAAANKKAAAPVKALNDQIEALKKTLVITTGDNYVGSAEPQLREKISDLYATLTDYYGQPSNLHLENLKMLQKRMADGETKYADIKTKLFGKVKDLAVKQGMKAFETQTKEDFLK